jgi:putative oxidoreductase
MFSGAGDAGLLFARLALGVVFLAFGYAKLFTMGIDNVAQFVMAANGIPAPVLSAWVVALVEFVGGIAIILGLFARYFAVGHVVIMIVAIITMTGAGALAGTTGPSMNIALIGCALVVLFCGPGKYSLDMMMFKKEL